MLSQGQIKLRFLPPSPSCQPCGTWVCEISEFYSVILLHSLRSHRSYCCAFPSILHDGQTNWPGISSSVICCCLWFTANYYCPEAKEKQGGNMSLRHISFEVIPERDGSLFLPFFDQQLSLKINLPRSPRRFDIAPQSLTAFKGSCCSTSNPLPLPLPSPPGKTTYCWG